MAGSSAHLYWAYTSDFLPWHCMYHEKYSVVYVLFVVFLLQLILRIHYTLYLLSLFQPNSDDPLLCYAFHNSVVFLEYCRLALSPTPQYKTRPLLTSLLTYTSGYVSLQQFTQWV